jgi:predicted CXXCH cytochrome family protein
LQDYFTRKFADPNADDGARERRRLPGRQDEAETCTDSTVECANRAARKEIESQFTRRGCVGCHGVIDTQSANLFDRFQVIPIRFARDFYPDNRFDHRSHQIQGKLTGDDACMSCHAAKKSKDSSDLMVPGLTKCTECHGDKAAAETVTLQCVSCHSYHPRDPSLLDLRTQIDRMSETKSDRVHEIAGL